MSGATFKSNRSEFNKMNDALLDYIQQDMAMNIEVLIKTDGRTPVDKGLMKKGVRHFKSPKGGYRVESEMEYSAYQERGSEIDGSRKVVNYTTGGTGAGWFQSAIDKTIERRAYFISMGRKAFGL